MNAFIPKDQTAGVRLWKLNSLDTRPAASSAPSNDAARVAAINRKAYREGYDAGYAAGARAAASEAERLSALLTTAQAELTGLDQRICGELVTTALALARAIVRESLAARPEQVEAVVREAMRALPIFNQTARLRLHPDDADLVEARLAPELGSEWVIIRDTSIERGGCRVETSAGDVDATLESRLARVAASLAADTSWAQ